MIVHAFGAKPTIATQVISAENHVVVDLIKGEQQTR